MNNSEDKIFEQAKFISLLRAHKPEAMEMLYEEFASIIYGVIWRIVKDEREAENVLTKTFVYIWQNGSTFNESKQNLCVWMIGIARGFAQDKVSFRTFLQNREILSFVDIQQNNNKEDKSPNTDFFEGDSSCMTPEQKLVLNLVFFGGGKIKEVSEHLGMEEEKVKRLLREALSHYRKQLEQAS